MSSFRLSGEQELIYRAYRAVDLTLERAYRAEPSDDERVANDDVPSVRALLANLQINNVEACTKALIEAGVNPSEPDDGLHNWLAQAFAEHCDLALALEGSVNG